MIGRCVWTCLVYHQSMATKWESWYPLVNLQKAIENGPVEIVDLPIKNSGSFHSYVNVYQRVSKHCIWGVIHITPDSADSAVDHSGDIPDPESTRLDQSRNDWIVGQYVYEKCCNYGLLKTYYVMCGFMLGHVFWTLTLPRYVGTFKKPGGCSCGQFILKPWAAPPFIIDLWTGYT